MRKENCYGGDIGCYYCKNLSTDKEYCTIDNEYLCNIDAMPDIEEIEACLYYEELEPII